MHPRLTVILAKQHIADLHRAADQHRLVHAAAITKPPPDPDSGHPVPETSGSFLRGLRRRFPRTQRGRLRPRREGG
jgi:hypothetical protein